MGMIATSLVFCIFSTLMTPLDIWGAFKRMNGADATISCVGDGNHATVIIAGVLAFEDIPQLALNCIFINAIAQNTDLGIDPIAVFSLLASVSNILWNMILLCYIPQKKADESAA